MRNAPTKPGGFRGEFHVTEPERTRFAEAAGILRSLPDAVAVPRDADDLAALVRWCAETRTPLVPRAAATGMPGGNLGSGVVVDLLSPFRRILGVEGEQRRARVEPGVTLAELNHEAARNGLHFPVDPSSGARCTLGGMIANNAAGAHSVRYGATRDWVEALDVILADGTRTEVRRGSPPAEPRLRQILATLDEALRPAAAEIADTWPRVRKNSSGYALREYLRSGDAVDLLVGSEGTLALIVAAELRLVPLPAYRGLALLEFTDLVAAGAAVLRVLEMEPATCEILDRTFLELVRDAGADVGYPLRPGLEAILLVEMEADSESGLEQALQHVASGVAGIADRVSLATDVEQQKRFWQVRKAASPIIAQRSDSRVSMQFIEDGVVPVERLPDYILALRRILGAHGVPAVIFGHAGDGNLHVNPLVDVSAPGWRNIIETILWELAAEIRALGGTLAGEHGDGRLRAPLLETVWGSGMVAHFRQVKQTFDPVGILNPGVILPLPGQRPLETLRDYAAVVAQRTRSGTWLVGE
jgi:FAD/FMN-containing dehydrogenase